MNKKHIFAASIFLTVSFFTQTTQNPSSKKLSHLGRAKSWKIKQTNSPQKPEEAPSIHSFSQLFNTQRSINFVVQELYRISNPRYNLKSRSLRCICCVCNSEIKKYSTQTDPFSTLIKSLFTNFKDAAITRNKINEENTTTAEASPFYPILVEQATRLSSQMEELFNTTVLGKTPEKEVYPLKFNTETRFNSY